MYMNILSFFSAFCFPTYLFMGIYVYYTGKQSPINKIFFSMCLLLAAWAVSVFFLYSAEDIELIILPFKLNLVFLLLYFAMNLHFCMSLTLHEKVKPLFFAFLYLPAVILSCANISTFIVFKDFIKVGNYWTFVPATDSVWFFPCLAYIAGCLVFSVFLLFRWGKRVRSRQKKRLSGILVSVLSVIIITGFAEEMIIPKLTSVPSFGLLPIFLFIWMFGVM